MSKDAMSKGTTTYVDPAEVMARAVDSRHEILDVRVAEPYVFAKLEPHHVAAVTEWARGRSLEPVLSVLEPQPGWVTGQHLMRAGPRISAAALTEVLLGHKVTVLEHQNAWVRVRTEGDAYLGWLPQEAVIVTSYAPTHALTALRAHAYAGPRVQATPVATLSWGSRVTLVQVAEAWAHVSLPDGRDGFVKSNLLRAAADVPVQPVLETWRGFLGAPYLWGGCSAWGLDCSGLMQLLYRMAGLEIPRDADEQYESGVPVSPEAAKPGDLVAFKGHVGLYLGEDRMVHANAANMAVTVDDFRQQEHLRSIFLGFVRYTP